MKKLLFCICIFYSLNANAQDYLISFVCTGASANISTVKVENLTSGTSLIINGTDILHLTSISTGINRVDDNQFPGLKVYPNPMTDHSVIELFPPEAGVASISVCDVTGNLFVQTQSYLENSKQEFALSGLKTGLYLINVRSTSYQYTTKLICRGNATGTVQLRKLIINQAASDRKNIVVARSTQGTVDMEYTNGDRLKFTGTSGNYRTVKIDIPRSNKTISFDFVECKDGDINNYPVVGIGTQVWMTENLKTTKFNDGTSLINVSDNTLWGQMTSGAYCWYNNNQSLKDSYGALYNWYIINSGANGGKNVCPTGWHVPTDEEWTSLTDFLGGLSVSGTKLKENGLVNWMTPNTGTNESGFTAFGVGDRSVTGGFAIKGQDGTWWTSSSYDNINGWFRSVSHDQNAVNRNYYNKANGFSVRCLKGGMPVLSASAVISVTQTTAVAGGNITNDGGSAITARGVCWSNSTNPTIANNKTVNGSGTGSFTSTVYGLTANTTYYLRAYTTNSSGTYYSNELIFKTYTGTVTDIDGNVYNTVTIGTTVWMAENLRTMRYRKGDTIGGHSFGYYAPMDRHWVIGDDEANAAKYGRLYNRTASDDSVCPIGWRLPGYSDWRKLTNNADSTYDKGAWLDGYIKFPVAKSLAATTDWLTNDMEGSVGKSLEYNNITGFTALPGANSLSPSYGAIGEYGSWYIQYCPEIPYGFSTVAEIWSENNNLIIHSSDGGAPSELRAISGRGNSIRCIRGSLLADLSTSNPPKVTINSIESGGNISSDAGLKIIARGVCWSKSPNPTITNDKTSDGVGTGSFTSSISELNANTVYYLRAYATNIAGTSYGNEFIIKTFTGTVSDIDGNKYYTVTIGTQEWMAENLKTTKYRNGNSISNTTDDLAWSNLTTGGYCSYNNSSGNIGVFGGLYNYFAVSDQGQLCPSGWHVSTDRDWTTLTNYLIDNGYSYEGTGDDIAKSLSFTEYWSPSKTKATPGNDISSNNSSGFGAIAGGDRSSIGTFSSEITEGTWWSWTEYNSTNAWYRSMNFNSDGVTRGNYSKSNGFSVRCLKGELVLPTITTVDISTVKLTSASSGGNITSDGGTSITNRGVCWSITPNPTTSNSHSSDGTGAGLFTSSLTGLTANTTYYLKSYATNSLGTSYGNEVILKTSSGVVTDIDGNTYYTVTIGTQVWMAENLKVTHFNDGSDLPNIIDATEWRNRISPAYCWYNNDALTEKNTYGALYNWYAVNTSKLCPVGWHVFSIEDWSALETSLGDEGIAGGKLKESGLIHWKSPNTGATNESGFKGLPGGCRNLFNDTFIGVGTDALWWTSSIDKINYPINNPGIPWRGLMYYSSGTNISIGNGLQYAGLSVRCIKDN